VKAACTLFPDPDEDESVDPVESDVPVLLRRLANDESLEPVLAPVDV
jgi:hypothetical protein